MATAKYPVIHFITDQKEGEPDILEAVKYRSLRVFCDGLVGKTKQTKEIEAPAGGWTHDLLTSLDQYSFGVECVGEAYVGGQWVGSTEV